ncbi:hypothetical protein JOE31_002818 [Arthrobacter sp. PvP023]|uniref:HupE/UreJ family protein n=1 Tax=Micrococcaceae TaxID=1268 RepID=UPI001AE5F102|nr:HupE/UreJ family protein [Arthrobacter sp. PvP023]MBP1136586.1 hypothetical protein [Arthrobacter sp. PvP023]
MRRIAAITLAFTLGHSATLALGTFGLPGSSGLIEALIAASSLIAAVHAVRPLFPGKEILVAGFFGLVKGLAFSETLRGLGLAGSRLILSLLAFNLGIEVMQLAVVALILPPLVLLAAANRYTVLRIAAASAVAVAAAGWFGARLGIPNAVATAANNIGALSLPIAALLWITSLAIHLRPKAQRPMVSDASQVQIPRPTANVTTRSK